MNGRLASIELRVDDIDESFRFYRDLVGLDIEAPSVDGPDDQRHTHALWGDRDDGSLLVLTLSARGTEEPSRSRLGFYVDGLDDAHQRLVDAGVQVRRAPEEMPWGRSAAYLDPDGNMVSLTERTA